MSYFEFDDVRRLHMPYEDAWYRSKLQVLFPLNVIVCSKLLASPSIQ